jgi:hypothetical protein
MTTTTYVTPAHIGSIITMPPEQAMNLNTGRYYDCPPKAYVIDDMIADTESPRHWPDEPARHGRYDVTLRRVRPDGTTSTKPQKRSLPGPTCPQQTRTFTITPQEG